MVHQTWRRWGANVVKLAMKGKRMDMEVKRNERYMFHDYMW